VVLPVDGLWAVSSVFDELVELVPGFFVVKAVVPTEWEGVIKLG
jgi:hypothetical protein